MDNQPAEYKATQSVRFTPAFHSGPGDQFRAYIANGYNTSAANTTWPEGPYRYGYNGKVELQLKSRDFFYAAAFNLEK